MCALDDLLKIGFKSEEFKLGELCSETFSETGFCNESGKVWEIVSGI